MPKKVPVCIVKFFILVIVAATLYYNHKMQTENFLNKLITVSNNLINVIYNYNYKHMIYWEKQTKELKNSEQFASYLDALDQNILERNPKLQFDVEKKMLNVSEQHERTKYVRFVGYKGNDLILVKDGSISKNYIDHSKESFYVDMFKTQKTKFYLSKVDNKYVVNIIEPIYIKKRKIGFLVIGHNLNEIISAFDVLTKDGFINNIFIVNKEMKLLFSSDMRSLEDNFLIYTNTFPINLKENKEQIIDNNIITTKYSEDLEIYLCITSYKSNIEKYLNRIFKINLVTFLIITLSFIISCIISFKFMHCYFKPPDF